MHRNHSIYFKTHDRYEFNGMECDSEVNGQGNSYTSEFRQYEPRIGRWLSLDPLMGKYPHQSAYAGFNNNPIMYADPTGLEGENPIEGKEVEGIEAQDNISWNYGSEMPSIPQSYKNGPDVTTYDWDNIYDNFDQDGEGILNQEKCLNDLANQGTNTCAIKLSNALNKSGYPIPKSKDTPADIRIRTGKKGDSGNFVLDAASMANYLKDIQNPTETFTIKTSEGIDKMVEIIHSKYDDMYGIIVYVADKPGAYGATGHADLIYEDYGWDLAFYSGHEVGPYLKDHVLLATTFTVYIWVMGYDK
jgi:RHS repeat-associated protein